MNIFKNGVFWWLLIVGVIFVTMLPILINPQFGLTDNGIAYTAAKYELQKNKTSLRVLGAWLKGDRFENIGRYRPLYFFETTLQFQLFGENPFGYWLWLLIKIILILTMLFLIIHQLTQNYFLSFIFSIPVCTFSAYRCQISTYETQEPLQAVFILSVFFLLFKIFKNGAMMLTFTQNSFFALMANILLFGAYFYKETTLGFLPIFLITGLYLIVHLKYYFAGLFFILINLFFSCVVLSLKPTPNINASAKDYVNGIGILHCSEVFINKLWNVFTENPIITFVLALFLFLIFAEYIEWICSKKIMNFFDDNNFFILIVIFAMLCNVAFLSLWVRGDHPKYDLLRSIFSCIILAWGFVRFVLPDFSGCGRLKLSFCCMATFFFGLQGFQNLKNIYRDYLWIQRDREMVMFLANNTKPGDKVYQNFLAYEQTVEILLQLKHFYSKPNLKFYNALPSSCSPYGDINYQNKKFFSKKDNFDYVIIDKAWNRFKKPEKPFGHNFVIAFENKNWIILEKCGV